MKKIFAKLRTYKIFTISTFVLLSINSVLFQTELWPFSCYPMFNERFDLIMRDDHKSYSLAGTHDQKKWTEIKDPKVLGVITPAIVSLFITEELRKKDPENFQKTMQYWRSRYKGTRSELRQEMSGFTYLGIRLKEIKENSEIVESIHWITEI